MRVRFLIVFYLITLFCLVLACGRKTQDTYLILGIKTEDAVESYLDKSANSIKESMREKGIKYDQIEQIVERKIQIKIASEEFVSETQKLLEDYINFDILHPVEWNKTKFQLSLRPQEVQRIEDYALSQTLEVIRNRINQFGIRKSMVHRQDPDKILITLPGIKATKRIINVICKPAKLEFKLVNDAFSLEEALKGNIPPEDEILYEQIWDVETREFIKKPYLLKKRALMTGDMITDAALEIGGEHGEPYVAIKFSRSGAELFEQITAENVGHRLAIILDKNVYSAPVIRERIAGGRAVITGRFTKEEAYDLATVLRAGTLPVPVNILQQDFT